MARSQEIALFQIAQVSNNANKAYWVFSRQQIEFILSNIPSTSSQLKSVSLGEIPYQNNLIPALYLERHFAVQSNTVDIREKYIVIKIPTHTGTIQRLAIRSIYPLHMRPLDFSTKETTPHNLKKNKEDILGAFTDKNEELYILPNIPAILEKLSKNKK